MNRLINNFIRNGKDIPRATVTQVNEKQCDSVTAGEDKYPHSVNTQHVESLRMMVEKGEEEIRKDIEHRVEEPRAGETDNRLSREGVHVSEYLSEQEKSVLLGLQGSLPDHLKARTLSVS
jgi:hypothetical protein